MVQSKIKKSTMLNRTVKTLFLAIGTLALLSIAGCKWQATGMLDPKGWVTHQELKLFYDTLALMLIVVIPVIIMSFAFVYHYQSSHRVRDYKPNWSHSYFLETIWWSIPCVIIVILAVLTWKKTHELDPYAPLPGMEEKPMLVQAIALPWKWLFIYPEQKIATINYLQVPVGRQIEYWITADNVAMSAFFIPQLGSQIYAMAGMRTRLHLFANETGVFDGMNTQYNGGGFSDMHFSVHVVPEENMNSWYAGVKKSSKPLTKETYDELLKPSLGDKPQFFSNVEDGFFEDVIMTYMHTFGTVHPRINSSSDLFEKV